MDRTTKKLFKYIYKNPVGLNLNHLSNIFPNSSAINESYNILKKEKLITYRDDYITLTVKGYDYYYNRRKELLLKILKTLISPIVVGVVTAIVTAKLASLPDNCNCNVTCNYPDNNLKQDN